MLKHIFSIFNRQEINLIELIQSSGNIIDDISTGNFKYVKPNIKIKHIPNYNELIYFDNENKYYRVVNNFHSLGKKHIIWIIIEPLI